MFYIDENRCVGCGLCADNCYFGAVEEQRKDGDMSGLFGTFYYGINQEKCAKCGKCAQNCPIGCIQWQGDEPAPAVPQSVEIIPDLCKGCSLCSRVCPVNAISGVVREPFVIDQQKCIRCGCCVQKCRFNAIQTGQSSGQ